MKENHHDQAGVEIAKNQQWASQQPLMEKMTNQGAAEFFKIKNLPQISEAFSESKDQVCCMDEGTAHLVTESKMGLAGAGILYPAGSWEERLERVAEIMATLGVKEITSHDGCGAAKLAYERDGGAEKLGSMTPDEYGKKWAEELSAKLKAEYQHIAASAMARPAEFHNARTVWFDATGKFNPDKLGSAIPQGFLIDYGNETKLAKNQKEREYPYAELAVAIKIAFGDHGLGQRFTSENPLVVVVIAKDADELEKVKAEVATHLPETEKGRLKVDGFVTG
jgi:hypothetical protein